MDQDQNNYEIRVQLELVKNGERVVRCSVSRDKDSCNIYDEPGIYRELLKQTDLEGLIGVLCRNPEPVDCGDDLPEGLPF